MQYLPMFVTVSRLGDMLEVFTLCNALRAHLLRALRHAGDLPEIPIITEAVYAQVRDQN